MNDSMYIQLCGYVLERVFFPSSLDFILCMFICDRKSLLCIMNNSETVHDLMLHVMENSRFHI